MTIRGKGIKLNNLKTMSTKVTDSGKKPISPVCLFVALFITLASYGAESGPIGIEQDGSMELLMKKFNQIQNGMHGPINPNNGPALSRLKKTTTVVLMPDSCVPVLYFKQVTEFIDSLMFYSASPNKPAPVLYKTFLDHAQQLSHDAIRSNSLKKVIQTDRVILLKEMVKSYRLPVIANDPDMFCKSRIVEGVLDGSVENLFRQKKITHETRTAFTVLKKALSQDKSRLINFLFITKPENLYQNFNDGKTLAKTDKIALYMDAIVRDLEAHFKWSIVERNIEAIDTIWKYDDFQSVIDDYELTYIFSKNAIDTSDLVSVDKLRYNAVLQTILRDAAWHDGLDFTEYFSIPKMVFNKSISGQDSLLLLRRIIAFGSGHRNFAVRKRELRDSIQWHKTCHAFDSLVALEMDTILLELSDEASKPIRSPRLSRITVSGYENADFFSIDGLLSGISGWCSFLNKNSIMVDSSWFKTIYPLHDSNGFVLKGNSCDELTMFLKNNRDGLPMYALNNLRLLFGGYFAFSGEFDMDKLKRIIKGKSTFSHITIPDLVFPGENRF